VAGFCCREPAVVEAAAALPGAAPPTEVDEEAGRGEPMSLLGGETCLLASLTI